MFEGLFSLFGSLAKNFEVGFDLPLTHIFIQGFGSENVVCELLF